MQKKGTIDKKTGRLIPPHEATIKTLSKAELRQMIRTGRNPRLGKGPGSKETKLEGRYFKEMKAKGINKYRCRYQHKDGSSIPGILDIDRFEINGGSENKVMYTVSSFIPDKKEE